jgi:hypothetical protein
MFELIFDSRGPNVVFLRSIGRIKIKLPSAVYLPLGVWQTAVSKIVCTHNLSKTDEGPVFLISPLVQQKMVNGLYKNVLHVGKIANDTDSSCMCESPVLSYCETAVTELSELVIDFVKSDGNFISISNDFELAIVLIFVKTE